MAVRKFGIDEIGQREKVNVWRCETCNELHVKAGNILLTFTPPEFAEFVDETGNCYYEKEFNLAIFN